MIIFYSKNHFNFFSKNIEELIKNFALIKNKM